MEHQLSFGVERDVLVDELEYYFDQTQAAEMEEDEFQALDSRGKANSMLRKLEFYGWIEVETDKSYVQRVNFKEYAVKKTREQSKMFKKKSLKFAVDFLSDSDYKIKSGVADADENMWLSFFEIVNKA